MVSSFDNGATLGLARASRVGCVPKREYHPHRRPRESASRDRQQVATALCPRRPARLARCAAAGSAAALRRCHRAASAEAIGPAASSRLCWLEWPLAGPGSRRCFTPTGVADLEPARDLSGPAPLLVYQYRPGVCPQGGRHRRDLSPPARERLVLAVDEKPHIQVLERAQGYLKLPNGKTLSGFSHDYKRHGTTTLFAAFNVLTGQVPLVHHRRRRRRREFLDFMNELFAAYGPDQIMHVILDNLSTHKPKHDRWLARHPNVHFHFIPTRASWLNQIECWFSILSRQALQGASFTSAQQLRQAIDRFIESYNPRAVPFEWKKEKVHSVHPKRYYAYLCH